jgi:ATP-dependent Clp protease ATP-binding subunit ClpC
MVLTWLSGDGRLWNMFERFTNLARRTVVHAQEEARLFDHNYIGTEHILLGLIREGDGVGVQILRDRTDIGRLRTAVLTAIPDSSGTGEALEGSDETNAVLRWLRSRLTRHTTSVPFRPDIPGITSPAGGRGTPAAEAALQQAARLAGTSPVGSHHLLLAALDDSESAASWALASLGVDLDELREKLRSAKLAGTSDEPPEQAGRRQMAIEVSDEMLHVVLTDPVIVAEANEALRAVNARAAQLAAAEAAASAAGTSETSEPAGASEAAAGAGEETAAAPKVIRGDLPAAAGLANVWLELHKTFATLKDTGPGRAKPDRLTAEPGEPVEAG